MLASISQNKYTTFYIVRHGETDWNTTKKIQGSSDIHLNERGIKQAEALSLKLNSIIFSSAFSSNLSRAKDTGNILLAKKNVQLQATNSLKEREFGSLEGKSTDYLHKMHTLFATFTDKQILEYKYDQSFESNQEVMKRVTRFLRKVGKEFFGQNILVVTHSGVIRPLLVELGAGRYTDFPSGSIDNGAYLKILFDGKNFFLAETDGIHKR